MEASAPTAGHAPARAPSGARAAFARIGALAGKLFLIFLVICALNVGVMMIAGLVNERESRFQQVGRDIGATWGASQTLAGPVLAVPYGVAGDLPGAAYAVEQGTLYLLPEQLAIHSEVEPDTLRRGIFEAVVYSAGTTFDGHFALDQLDAPPADDSGEPTVLLWERARVVVAVSDMRSIDSEVALRIGGERVFFAPGRHGPLFDSGMSAALPASALPEMEGGPVSYSAQAADDLAQAPTLEFSFALELDGSRSLSFLPLARETRVTMRSPWADPSFQGAFLPDERSVSDSAGFTAAWALSHFGRPYPGEIDSASVGPDLRSRMDASAFGVALYQPVTTYRQVQRATKYGLLFIVLTFGLYFLVEVISGRPVHPIQYALVGVPLCLFFLLLVAFAEHIGFTLAYVAGAVSIVGLVGGYSLKVLCSAPRAGLVAGLLGGLYAYLYLLLQQESFSLLGGALGLLALTAAFMWATRDIDWYTASRRPNTTPPTERVTA